MRNDEPSAENIRGASARIFHKLQTTAAETQPELINGCDDIVRLLPPYQAGELSSQRALLVETHLRDCVNCRMQAEGRTTVLQWKPASSNRPARRWSGFAVAAAAIVFAVIGFYINNTYFAVPAGARATLQSLEGVAYQVTAEGDRPVGVGQQLMDGDILRTGASSHAYVKLTDGSLVEVNERSAFAVKARGKDTTIALDRGAVIIQAAHRASGHLYVKTADCRVAVTGTIFSVKSGIKGSRVSVIQGTVEVAHSGIGTKNFRCWNRPPRTRPVMLSCRPTWDFCTPQKNFAKRPFLTYNRHSLFRLTIRTFWKMSVRLTNT